jgi:hypothetical protein
VSLNEEFLAMGGNGLVFEGVKIVYKMIIYKGLEFTL